MSANRINDLLSEIMEDRGVPRNIKSSIEESISIIGGNDTEEEKIASIISILDEASTDPNISLHTRTRIWNTVSVLEGIKNE
jgi:uncharacterized protein (UPF0147 family)